MYDIEKALLKIVEEIRAERTQEKKPFPDSTWGIWDDDIFKTINELEYIQLNGITRTMKNAAYIIRHALEDKGRISRLSFPVDDVFEMPQNPRIAHKWEEGDGIPPCGTYIGVRVDNQDEFRKVVIRDILGGRRAMWKFLKFDGEESSCDIRVEPIYANFKTLWRLPDED